MKKQPIKFSEYPLVVPSAKRMSKKLDKLVSDLKACQNANEAFKVINKINAFFEELETETSGPIWKIRKREQRMLYTIVWSWMDGERLTCQI